MNFSLFGIGIAVGSLDKSDPIFILVPKPERMETMKRIVSIAIILVVIAVTLIAAYFGLK